jgi:hypothetical protein
MPGSMSSGATRRVTKCGAKFRMSASSQQMMSPSQAYSESHSALPLPDPGGRSGRISSTGTTTAPSLRATAAVASVESSMTRTSSTRATSSTRCRRTDATIGPMVVSSLRAGRHTETVVPALARTIDRRLGADRIVGKE